MPGLQVDGAAPRGPAALHELGPTSAGYRSEVATPLADDPVPSLSLGPRPVDEVLLEIDWQDGSEDLVRLGDLRGAPAYQTDDGRSLQVVQRDAQLVLRADGAGVALRSVRAHRFDLAPGDLATALARLELLAAADAGLYAPHPSPDQPGQLLKGPRARDLPAGGPPWLLLVHGTAGSTEVGFDPLAEAAPWARIQATWADRVLTYEHRTLTEGPLTSAIDLLRGMSADMTLDVLAMSRGGLVAELLCHGPIAPSVAQEVADRCAAEALPGFEARAFLDAAAEFSRLWADRRPRVRRLVRVGTAIAGIPLLQQGSARFYGLLFASARLAFDHDARRVDGRHARFLGLLRSARLVVRRATRAQGVALGLPGMDAQRPDAPVVRLLNRPEARAQPVAGELAVVGGDFQGWDPVTKAIQLGAARIHGLPLLGDHDVVIPLATTRGGLRRLQVSVRTERGPHAHHFGYLREPPCRDWMVRWLSRP